MDALAHMCEFFLYQMLLAMRLSPPVFGGPIGKSRFAPENR